MLVGTYGKPIPGLTSTWCHMYGQKPGVGEGTIIHGQEPGLNIDHRMLKGKPDMPCDTTLYTHALL